MVRYKIEMRLRTRADRLMYRRLEKVMRLTSFEIHRTDVIDRGGTFARVQMHRVKFLKAATPNRRYAIA